MEVQRETETEDPCLCLKSYKNFSVCASPGTTSFFRLTVMGMTHDPWDYGKVPLLLAMATVPFLQRYG